MKKLSTAAICVALAVVMVPAVASAKDSSKWSDKSGRFGIGYDQTLGGVGGLSARFQVAKNFGVQGVLSFGRVSIDTKNDDNTVATEATGQRIRGALRGDVGVAYTKKAALSVIFGVNVLSDSNEVTAGGNTESTDDTRFSFEAGLKAEYHFTNFFSVHGEVGLLFALVNRASDVGPITSGQPGNLVSSGSTDGTDADVDGSIILFGLGETFGNFGFTFWFK